ncbi:MAG TPA: AMP-binding protein [Bacteroidales bacterium]|nr:AMP-binding protein [Bacteroidales bacterium]
MIKENLVLYFEQSIKQNWEKPALSDYKGTTLTYGDVAVQIAKIHLLFERNGVRRGDKVSLIGKNASNWAIVYLATVTYGAVIVPILPEFKPNDVHHIINHSDSVVLFTSNSLFENMDLARLTALRAVISLDDFSLKYSPDTMWDEDIKNIGSLFEAKFPYGFNSGLTCYPSIANSELAVISYTSGTTGFSKGVMLSHNSLAANMWFARNNMPLKPSDRIVSFLPLAHAYGCAFEFLFPFSIGCHITFLTKTPSPQIIIQAFDEIKPRLILSVPLIIEKIYKKQLLPVINKPAIKILLRIPLLNIFIHRKIRKKLCSVFGGNFHEVVIGGAAFNAEAEAFLRKIRFPFTVGYGMTECGPLISYSSWKETRLHSAGKNVDTLEVKIDSDDPYTKVGEILVKGDNTMSGYYKNEEATKAVIDEDGWLHTGDQGLIDKKGNIYIKGRSKTMILGPSGQNIYPEEIESLLNNKDFILESLVIEDKGRLVALLYPDYEMVDSRRINDEQLNHLFNNHIREINHHLPNYMNLAKFTIHREEFEKTPKRSIKRFLYVGDNN